MHQTPTIDSTAEFKLNFLLNFSHSVVYPLAGIFGFTSNIKNSVADYSIAEFETLVFTSHKIYDRHR
jgi:hypothetical protein